MKEGSSAAGRSEGSVVVIANRLPFPIDDGWKARTFHILQQIALRRQTTLVAFGGDDSGDIRAALVDAVGGDLDVVTTPPPRPYTPQRLALGVVTRTPVYVWNNTTPAFRETLRTVVANTRASVGVAVCTFMYPYFQQIRFPGSVIIDTHNLDSQVMRRYAQYLSGPRRWYASVTASRLAGLERRVFPESQDVWVCSPEEQRHVLGATGARSVVIPNGVDCDWFAKGHGVEVAGRLLFFGTLNYRPNQDGLQYFLDEIFPRIRQRDPRVHLRVVGRGAPKSLMERCQTTPGVEHIGLVSDIRDELVQASIVVVPLRMGGGTRLKILEAMAAGRPVVSTSIGAEGLALTTGEQIVIEDEASVFAQETLALVEDAPRRLGIAAAGRQAALDHYDWAVVGQTIGARLEEMEEMVPAALGQRVS